MYKKFVRNTLMMTVALLIVCGSAIFAIDPITITIRPGLACRQRLFRSGIAMRGLRSILIMIA